MLALGLTLTLLAAPEAVPSARLVPPDELLSPADVLALDREIRILDGNLQLLRPAIPKGFVIGMVTGFGFTALLLPGISMLVIGATASSFSAAAFMAIGGVLTALGGVALMAALFCVVLGTNAEAEMAAEHARLVERRDALQKRLEPYRPPPQQREPSPGFPPAFPPGVQRDLPTPAFVTLARF